jgi:glycine oxidase
VIYDAAIVGGGLVGAACADALAGEGLRVCVLDRGPLGREASWAAAGILHPIHPWQYPAVLHPLLRRSPALHAACAADLYERTGIDVEFERSGMVVVEEDLEPLARWCAPEIRFERVDAGAVEPTLRPGKAALLLPEAAHVRNHRLVRAFLEGARRRGADLRPFSPVWSIGRGHIVVPDGRIVVSAVVLCAGAWSAQLCGDLAIEPVRGQMLLYGPESGVPLRHMVIFEGGAYAVPRRDGRILFGSTIERVGFDPKPTKTACKRLIEQAEALLGLAEKHLEAAWAGLRPATSDGLPYIGIAGNRGDLVLACGHYRNGVLLAPSTAKGVTDLVIGREPDADFSDLIVKVSECRSRSANSKGV